MNITKKLLYCMYCCLFTSCLPKYYDKEYDDALTRTHIKANRSITSQGYIRYGTGGSWGGELEILSEDYISRKDKFTTVEEARLFIVDKIETYLKHVNDCKELRPRLHQYPFGAEGVSISFRFENENGEILKPPFISYVSVITGKNYYDMHNTEKGLSLTFHEESYSDALTIYNEQRSKNEGSHT